MQVIARAAVHAGPASARMLSSLLALLATWARVLLLAGHVRPSIASNQCHQRTPKRCGPIISPGGHQLSVLTPTAHPPPNLLYVSRGGDGSVSNASSRVLVCVPAKAGSTSFYFWLFEALAGQKWPYDGPPWIQDVSSERWMNLTGNVRIARFVSMPFRQRARVLSDPAVRRFALTRDPLERALSSYYSKIACDTGDAADHAGTRTSRLSIPSPNAPNECT